MSRKVKESNLGNNTGLDEIKGLINRSFNEFIVKLASIEVKFDKTTKEIYLN